VHHDGFQQGRTELRCPIAFAAILIAGISGGANAQPRPPVGSPLPGLQAPPAPAVAPPPPLPPAAPAPVAAGQIFAITGATIDGATVYPSAALAALLTGLTGPAVPLEKIEDARAALLNRYRRAGYIYTTVRARISGSQLRLVVIEPHVVSVTLSQTIGPAGTLVLAFLNHLTDGRVLRQGDLERWVLLANDIPGVSVHVVLDPSATDPGALTLRAIVQRQAVGGLARADNRAFRQTGPEELLTVADFNSFTALGERTELSMFHTFNNTDNFGQASEQVFLGATGLTLKLYGGYGEAIPSGSLRAIGYEGVTRVFGGALSYPVIRSRQHDLAVALLFDGTESDISYDVRGPGTRASFDSLRIFRLDAEDTLSDIWLSAALSAQTVSGVTVSQGVPSLGASSNGNTQLPRLNERVDFTKADARLDRTQNLFSPYRIDGVPATVQIELAAEGQFTDDVLPPEEEYYLGGPQFNRGFYYGEVSGDRALTAKAQPQLVTNLPRLPAWGVVPEATFYGFYDWGETWQEQKRDASHILRSLGGGVRLALGEHLEIDLEGVSRLTRTPSGPPPDGQRLQSSAFYWEVVGKF
jgi:hemolysin activation/secretion protein